MNKKPSFILSREEFSLDDPVYTAPLLVCAVELLIALFSLLYRRMPETDALSSDLTVAVFTMATIALPALFYARCRQMRLPPAAFSVTRGDCVLPTLLATAALLFGSVVLTIATAKLGWSTDGYAVTDSFSMPETSTRLLPMVSTCIAFALVPAVCEEFLCRGVIFTEYSHYGAIPALLFSSLAFAMLHFSPAKLPVYLYAGLILGFLRWITHSAVASFFAHFIYNLCGLFYYSFFDVLSEQLSGFSLILILSLLFTLLALYFLFGEAERIGRHSAEAPPDLTPTPSPLSTSLALRHGVTLPFLGALLLYVVLVLVL